MAYRFTIDESTGAGGARCTDELLAGARARLQDDLVIDTSEAIHDARKAVKKQRTLLRLLRAELPGGVRRAENARLRDASRRLSGSRDAEAMLETLAALAARYPGQAAAEDFESVRAALTGARDAAAVDHRQADAAVAELDRARERVIRALPSDGGWAQIAPGLQRIHDRGRRALKAAHAEPTPDSMHELRKRVKDLWYSSRLLTGVAGPQLKALAQEAHGVADLLGDAHDLAVFEDTLDSLEVAADTGALRGLAEHRRAQLEGEALIAAAPLYSEEPHAFTARIGSLWGAGQRLAADRAARDPRTLAAAPRATP